MSEEQAPAAEVGQAVIPFLYRFPSAEAMAKLRGYLASEAHRSRQERIMAELLAVYPPKCRLPEEASGGGDAVGSADGGAASS